MHCARCFAFVYSGKPSPQLFETASYQPHLTNGETKEEEKLLTGGRDGQSASRIHGLNLYSIVPLGHRGSHLWIL